MQGGTAKQQPNMDFSSDSGVVQLTESTKFCFSLFSHLIKLVTSCSLCIVLSSCVGIRTAKVGSD